jgi:acyl dehydratase
MSIKEFHIIDEDKVKKFAELVGDYNPIHLDAEYAKGTKFGKPIVHGMLISSLFSSIIATKYPGPGSIYISQDIQFKNPCFVGEEIIVSVDLIEENSGRYKLKTQIKNKKEEILVDGEALIKNTNNGRI